MSILVAGATGKTGLRLTQDLLANGHQPIALVRDSSDTSDLPNGVELRKGDLTDLQPGVCDGCDVVVFAAGSGPDTGQDMTEKVDRDGAKRLVDLAKEAGVSRFVMLSTVGAGDPDPDSKLGPYLMAKHKADEHLKASGLDFAILRPVALTEEDGTRDIVYGDAVDVQGEAARGDVAYVLAQAVDDPEWRGKTLRMASA
ncbi:SDR family oxidoreductase [uncultured Marivita sp.]|uniref:SDR family oxidoreductase n=1 Tax=uncultured Marivita sp. TaxID=888080 RepID=UPI002606FA99|nr:SDR family oxidoreductase [uncultured Marivita sp.]